MDAVERLRRKAQNEATCFAYRDICNDQQKEIEYLRQQLKNSRKSATNGWNAYEDLRQASDEMIIELRQQLADLQAKYDAREQECRTAFGKEMELIKQLAECEREREKLIGRPIPLTEWQKMEKQLATVTKERDELVEAVLSVCCDPEGNVVIGGHDSDRAVLQAALAKLGADKTGEKG